jgi:hypothetical protein
VKRTTSAALALASLVCSSAQAGRRTLGFTPDATQLSPGVVEVEQWIWLRAYEDDVSAASSGWLWFGPVYGVSERLEIALPWQLTANQQNTRLMAFGLEGRYAFFDPLDETLSFRPQLRMGWQQNFSHPDNGGDWLVPWLTLDLVGTFGAPNRQHVSFDAGLITDFRARNRFIEHQLGVGAVTPFPLFEQLLVGAEYRHQVTLSTGSVGDRRWFFLGPTAAYARGRLWISFALLVGVGDLVPRFLPRLSLGLVL